MNVRVWKIIFTAIFSLLVFFYAIQNVANITGGMFASFAYLLSQADHVAYPESVMPAITQPALIWFVLLLVLVLEFVCGTLVGVGAWHMWKYRAAMSGEFRAAKAHALNGFGVGVVFWLLLFGTFGRVVPDVADRDRHEFV